MINIMLWSMNLQLHSNQLCIDCRQWSNSGSLNRSLKKSFRVTRYRSLQNLLAQTTFTIMQWFTSTITSTVTSLSIDAVPIIRKLVRSHVRNWLTNLNGSNTLEKMFPSQIPLSAPGHGLTISMISVANSNLVVRQQVTST